MSLAGTVETNILAMFALTRVALRHLSKGGVIINTGSITGLQGSKQLLDDSSTKGGRARLARSTGANLQVCRVRQT